MPRATCPWGSAALVGLVGAVLPGDRVVLNPATFPELSPVGRLVVLTHEMTHVAARAGTGRTLPVNGLFQCGNPQLAGAYEEDWLACRVAADRWGQRTLVRLYRRVGTSAAAPALAVAQGDRAVLDTTVPRFTGAWRRYLVAVLS